MVEIIYSEKFLEHQTGRWHPERPERLKAIANALKSVEWADQLQWQTPTPVAQRKIGQLLQQIHTPAMIARVQNIAETGGGMIDTDTVVSPRSYEVALLAVSAWLDGVDRVLATGKAAFVLARPPGHHATKNESMGFCLFSNAAIASHYALTKPGVERVAILDWDVHHGNGTEDIVANNPNIIYCSLHQSPCYPGTGSKNDKGMYNNILNLPMSAGSTIADYQPVFETEVLPFIDRFNPDLIIVSAGYDANHADPLASISLQPQDYGVFTQYLLQISTKILFGLEGGYDLEALSQSVIATVASLIATK